MKTTGKIVLSVFFAFLMVGAVYAWDIDGINFDGNPPIWQIYKGGKPVYWVTWQANPRFAIYNPGTFNDPKDDMVLDKETGLVWERSPSTSPFYTWNDGQHHCNNLTLGNRKGWRLPTVQEHASLVDPSVPPPGPTLPSGHPFTNVQSAHYWSATTQAYDTSVAWGVNFTFGVVSAGFKSYANSFAWCVRGGQGVDPQ